MTDESKQNGAEKRGLPAIAATGRGLQLTTLEDMYRFAQYVVKAQMDCGLGTPEKVVVALQSGLEVGLSPMQAIQNIYVVRGRATIFGDALPGLVLATGLLEQFDEWFEDGSACCVCAGTGTAEGAPCKSCKSRGRKRLSSMPEKPPDEFTAWCFTRRRGGESRETPFSVGDAKRASLWEKRTEKGGPTPWITNPQRMLQWRARTFNFRDQFSDVLRGIRVKEEVEDYVIDVQPVAIDEQGNALKSLDARLRSCGAVTDEDKDLLCAYYSINGHGTPQCSCYDKVVESNGALAVLRAMEAEFKHGVSWPQMLVTARAALAKEV